jgi:hypothetical protein
LNIASFTGVPIPFSNLGSMIDELFIPTMVVQDSYENHAKKARLAYEDLVKFRWVPVRLVDPDPVYILA